MSQTPVGTFLSLDAGKITATIERLCRGAEHRFPDSGLARVCRELEEVAGRTAETAAWISRPIYLLRIAVVALVVLILGGLVGTVLAMGGTVQPLTFTELVLHRGRDAGIVERNQMSAFALSRYLDYCSELLSLTGKVAALYIQNFDDSVALQAVNEVEGLTTGLSRKIWQKLMIVYAAGPSD